MVFHPLLNGVEKGFILFLVTSMFSKFCCGDLGLLWLECVRDFRASCKACNVDAYDTGGTELLEQVEL